MKTVEVPTGFDFATVADLDIDTIGQAEIESAFRLDMPAHHRGWTAVSCRRNCRDNPGCLTFLGEDNWWWAEEEEVRPLNVPAGLVSLTSEIFFAFMNVFVFQRNLGNSWWRRPSSRPGGTRSGKTPRISKKR